MKFSLGSYRILAGTKLQYLIIPLFLWFFVKLIAPVKDGWLYYILGDLAGVAAGYIIFVSMGRVKLLKTYTPTARVISVGIAGLLLIIGINIYDLIISGNVANSPSEILEGSKFYILIDFIFGLVFLVIGSFIFVMLMELYYLKSRQARRTYYNAMLVFITLSCLTAFLNRGEYESLKFINLAFTVNAFILISFNSFRMAWIAFLNKVEKQRLILYSILLVVLFGLLTDSILETSSATESMKEFSLALKYYLMFGVLYGLIFFSILFFTALFHLPTAEAIDRKTKEFTSFQYLSKLINQVLDFKELSVTITELATQISGSEAAWLLMHNDQTLTPVAPKNIGFIEADKFRKELEDAGWKKENIEIKYLSLAANLTETKAGERFQHAVTVPLRSHNNVNATLVILKKGTFGFDQEDRSAIETFSDYASIALENSRLLQESIEKERLEKELDVAREMQRRLIPAEIPKVTGLDISAVFIPAFEVGGDYYDFFEMDSSRFGFVVGDVSGKGISAAFIMAELRGVFESLSRLINDPREILINANDILRKSLGSSSFVTVAFGIYDRTLSKVFLVRAGHTPIIYANGNGVEDLRPAGIGLGLNYSQIFTNSLETIELNLKDEDVLVVFTDGITEAKNSKMEDFGLPRLKEIISSTRYESAQEITNKIIHDVTVYSESSPQHDDITLLILKVKN